MAKLEVEREPDGCWVLWQRGRVAAEGNGRLRLALARVRLAFPLPCR